MRQRRLIFAAMTALVILSQLGVGVFAYHHTAGKIVHIHNSGLLTRGVSGAANAHLLRLLHSPKNRPVAALSRDKVAAPARIRCVSQDGERNSRGPDRQLKFAAHFDRPPPSPLLVL